MTDLTEWGGSGISFGMIHDNLPAAIEDLSARMIAIRDSL
jgi:hypothetical protein